MKYDEVSAKAGSGKKKGAPDYKKGPAETVKQEKKDLKKDMEGGMKNAGDVPGKKKGSAKHHGDMPKKKGAAEYGGKKGDDSKSKKDYEGGAKYKKGAGDYDVKKGSHDHPHGGPGRMGFTQNFGPARQNSYEKGAAKVAKIMGKGAYKKGAADAGHGADPGHSHDRYISPERLESNIAGTTSADMGMDLNEVVVSANANNKKSNKKRKNPKVKSIYKQKVTGVNAPVWNKSAGYGKGGAFYSPTGYSRLNPVFRKETVKRSQKQIDRMRSRGITFKEDN